jgi:hypothetical protein
MHAHRHVHIGGSPCQTISNLATSCNQSAGYAGQRMGTRPAREICETRSMQSMPRPVAR